MSAINQFINCYDFAFFFKTLNIKYTHTHTRYTREIWGFQGGKDDVQEKHEVWTTARDNLKRTEEGKISFLGSFTTFYLLHLLQSNAYWTKNLKNGEERLRRNTKILRQCSRPQDVDSNVRPPETKHECYDFSLGKKKKKTNGLIMENTCS